MPVDLERLLIRLEVTQRRFDQQMRNANRSADRTANNIERRFQGMNQRVQRSFVGLGSILVGGLGVRQVIDYVDAWTVAGNKIAAAGEVAGRAGRSLQGINDIADASRSGLTQTADLYAKLLRATRDVAESELEVARATEIVNKAFKAGGAATSEQAAGILQLGQGLSSGILQGDELRSLRENAPLVAQAIADEFRTTIGGLKQLGAEGKLTADRVFTAILNAQAPIEAAFARTNATIGDGISTLRNALTEYIGLADGSSNSTAKIGNALNALAENIDIAVAAGIALGARFIGPVLLRQLVAARAAIVAASGSLAGLGASARAAAVGMGALRGVLGVFGGPIGLAITTLTALPLVLEDSADRVEDLEAASSGAIQALDNYATATKRAADEQEELGGKVSAATQQILNQSRAQLQQAFRDLRDEYADLRSDLEDGIILNSQATSLGQSLSFGGASNNPILQELSEQLQAIGDGADNIQEVSDQLERLAGIGEETASVVDRFDIALQNASDVDLGGATESLVSIAQAIGGFGAELAAIENADTLLQQTVAAKNLRDALFNSAQAGSLLQSEIARGVREQLQSTAAAEDALRAVELALEGNVEEALNLASGISGATDAAVELASTPTPDYSAAAASASSLADQLSRAVGNAQTLASQALSDLRRSQIDIDFRDDPEGRAGALAGEQFDSRVGDFSGADPILRQELERQRDAFIENAEAAERNRQALSDLNTESESVASGGGGGAAARVASITDEFEQQTASLRRQAEELGLTSSEVAELRARYELLAFAKRNNIDLNSRLAGTSQTVREAIDAQAAAVGRLSEEIEKNEQTLEFVDGLLDDMAGKFADVFTDGDIKNKANALRDQLREVFRGIANDLISSGIRQAFSAVFGGTPTGAGPLNAILGAIGVPGIGSSASPAASAASSVSASQSSVSSPAARSIAASQANQILRNANLTTTSISPVTAPAAMAGVAVTVSVDDDGKLGAIARREGAASALPVALQVAEQNNKRIPSIVAESQLR